MISILVPTALTILAVLLLIQWRRVPSRFYLPSAVAGIVVLAVLCIWVIYLLGREADLVASITAIFSAGVVAFFGVLIAIESSGRRPLFGVIVAVAFPVAMLISYQIGNVEPPPPERDVQGELLGEALMSYRSDEGAYPASLDQLVPDYIDEVGDPGTQWGWLYTVENDQFWLAYLYSVDSMGYTLCIIRSGALAWNCSGLVSHPFQLPPEATPVPATT